MPFEILSIILLLSVVFIIFMTAKIKMNAFFVLIIAAFGVGILSGLPTDRIVSAVKDGFGNTIGAIGIVIIAGTSLGIVLKKTGAAFLMADIILKSVGKRNTTLAMNITGFLFGIPIFCDSGFVVLSSLVKALAIRSAVPVAVIAVSLASGLFSVHCLIPPHPGITAASGIFGVDLGQLMIVGLIIALPTSFAGYFWSSRFFKKNKLEETAEQDLSSNEYNTMDTKVTFRTFLSFVPVLLPIVLISLKSILLLFFKSPDSNYLLSFILLVGEPAIALLIGLAVSFFLIENWNKKILDEWLGEGVKDAGTILAITAAGGAFGAILKATGIGVQLGEIMAPLGIGLFLPFLISAALKTSQGSSTVAVITTASLIMPLLPELNLNQGWGPILTLLSMGAGSMIASHANDSYFWVVTKFSGIEMETSMKIFTTATIIMGITAQLFIIIFSIIVL